ncbi:f01db432-90cc-4280-ab3c-25f69ac0f34e [Thermothielavioides terrestris]|uniref:F01db432-90cc-4280-ab3c-25f69ac0f34e n=1 Tax=Thermothielavioides terrestris TaxID=2587410 RepID=A0A446BIB4_9PEZI|nr:f01db432-90cc-4280-ab3c-25f69ac0f34e [Thermothielavioides terrestris]
MKQQDAPVTGAIPDKMDEKNKRDPDTVKPEPSPVPSPTSPDPSATVNTDDANESLTSRLFRFLATASPGTLGGVAVGLAATTYLVLGRLGLVLIGAFGGIVSFIHWEQRNAEVARAVRGERGIDVLSRLLATKQEPESAPVKEQTADDALVRSFDDLQPETREALNELVDAVIDNYVKWWYSPIVPSDKFFPLACRKTLTNFLTSVSNCLRRKRPADAFLEFVTNSSSILVVFMSELSNAFSELPPDSKANAPDAIYNYLASHPESNLANLLNQKQQAGKLRMASEDLLGFLDRSSYECEPVRVFLREILAGVVLETTLQSCSKPEWINSWIVYLLESGEPDISQAIDVGMQTGPGADVAFADLDGNVGNIGLTKGNRNSFEQERARRKESMAHKKKLSKAEEEMELAMEEMRRLNQMIAQESALKEGSQKQEAGPPGRSGSAAEATERLPGALQRNVDNQGIKEEPNAKPGPPQPLDTSTHASKRTSSDGSSDRNEAIYTPATPMSGTTPSSSQDSSPPANGGSRFTSFDQIVPPAQDEAESEAGEPRKPPPLTLHNATVTVLDEPGDGRIRTKPTWDYLVQIEPATTVYPGWMIVRKYADFEMLHEVLRRIATISGATGFSEQHSTLPAWKVHTRTSLRGELERYLRDACSYQSLAESEGLKKFFERDHGHMPNAPKSGFQAFEKLGKNVLDVLTSAPLEGSKAVVGGVTGVLGNIGLGQRKTAAAAQQPPPPPPPSALQDVTAASRLSISALPRADSSMSLSGMRRTRDSMDSQRSSIVSQQPGKMPPMERRPSYNSQGGDGEPDGARLPVTSARNSREHSRPSSRAPSRAPPTRSPSSLSLDGFRLPPPPDMMPDDYDSPISPASGGRPQADFQHTRSLTMPTLGSSTSHQQQQQRLNGPPLKGVKQHAKLSEQETRMTVELLFAVINELYTLSSAWNIRRTLLAAAKSFLLRPGNPSLLSIQALIQTSVLDANTADAGVAALLRKLRANALPTDAERAAWPAEMSPADKDALRARARRLLIASGVPAALMGVMGQAATSEALGRLFDCLQIEEVARGLVFGVVLQA